MCIPVIGKNVKASISHVEHIVTKSIPFKNTMYTQKTIIELKVVVDKLEKCFQLRNWLEAASHDLLYFILFSLLA